MIFEIFDGIVGESFTEDEIGFIEAEAAHRFLNNIPPGFQDDGKDITYSYCGTKISAKYGDYILWKQLLRKAESEKLPVILVTGDIKEDWQSSEFSRVRPELITEFRLKTGQDFYALTLPDFQRHFDTKLKQKLSEVSKREIIDLANKDSAGWLDEILNAFNSEEKPLTLNEVYDYILANSNRELPPSWDVIIRRTIYNHCSDVSAYLGKKDYFARVSSGLYKLRQINER